MAMMSMMQMNIVTPKMIPTRVRSERPPRFAASLVVGGTSLLTVESVSGIPGMARTEGPGVGLSGTGVEMIDTDVGIEVTDVGMVATDVKIVETVVDTVVVEEVVEVP